MKHEILNRYTGRVQFTAEIDCKETDSLPIKIGKAAMWGIKNGADLSGVGMAKEPVSELDKDAEIAKLKAERGFLARYISWTDNYDTRHQFASEALDLARKIVKGE